MDCFAGPNVCSSSQSATDRTQAFVDRHLLSHHIVGVFRFTDLISILVTRTHTRLPKVIAAIALCSLTGLATPGCAHRTDEVTTQDPVNSSRKVFHVPTKLIAERGYKNIGFGVDTHSLKKITVDAREGLETGFIFYNYVVTGDQRFPAGEGMESGADAPGEGMTYVHEQPTGMLLPGKKYQIEIHYVLYEGEPRGGRKGIPNRESYNILWKKTLRTGPL